MTLKQFVVAVAAGAAAAILVQQARKKGDGGTHSGPKPIEGVGTQTPG